MMRHMLWLHLSGLPKEVQTTVKDLPFKGSKLFMNKTDASLHTLKDSRAMLQSLGIYTPGQKRKVSYQSYHKSHQPQYPPQRYYEPQQKKSKFQKHKPSGPKSSTSQPSTCKHQY
ncbi:hypothetical protein UY3_03698 [Chelonia mydas]|uniref:Uncharacterized protein n=1 Tax=Chelonia mydas TaxID=8469 RepID=M7BTH3_CHEMY|nr:hypothetical protein UY3_03698 [Chelonia mydas]